jgi:LAGLIDADG endonuclease
VYFDVTQTIDDIQVLVYIQKELGFGQIIKRTEEHRRVSVFYVSGKENFCKLINIFNGNLCSRHKKEQFKN